MSGQAIAAKVASALRRANGAVSNTGALSVRLLRTTGANETVYPPVAGSVTEYPCTAVVTKNVAGDRGDSQDRSFMVELLISPDVAIEPMTTDKLQIGSTRFDVTEVAAIAPGGVPLLWKCAARAS